MTQQPQQPPQQPVQIPPPPKPRTDLQPRNGETPEDQAAWLEFLADEPVDAWRDQDGMIYLRRMPASMAPDEALVDSPTYITPDSPTYGDWLNRVAPEYDFMEPTKLTPVPRQQKEMPHAAGTDTHAEA